METARLGLERARGRLRSAESSLETLLAQQANQDMHCQALQAAADELVVEVDQHTAALAELEGKAAACRASRVTAEEDQRKGQEQRDTANAELEAVRDKLAEVQDTITELVSQLAEQCEALRGHAGGDCGRGGDGWQSVDEAVAVLAQQSAGPGQGQLPGKFYGRLHSMLRLSNPDAATPVNACLRECWNLVSQHDERSQTYDEVAFIPRILTLFCAGHYRDYLGPCHRGGCCAALQGAPGGCGHMHHLGQHTRACCNQHTRATAFHQGTCALG